MRRLMHISVLPADDQDEVIAMVLAAQDGQPAAVAPRLAREDLPADGRGIPRPRESSF